MTADTTTSPALPWLTDSDTLAGLPASEVLVYGYVAEFGPARSSVIQREIALPRRTARDALRSLREADLIASRSAPYHPNDRVYSLANRDE